MTDSIVYTIGYVMITIGFIVGFATILAGLAEFVYQRLQRIHGLTKIYKALKQYEKDDQDE